MNAVLFRLYPSKRLWGIDLTTGQVKRKVGQHWATVSDPAEREMYFRQARLLIDHLNSPERGAGHDR